MVFEPDTSFFEDSLAYQGASYFYRLTAVDNQHNVSDYSDEVAVRPVSIRGFQTGDNLPQYSVITSTYPNPFNSDITVVYSVSNVGFLPAPIELKVYDIRGSLVRILIDEKKMQGTYRASWDGKDDEGVAVSSGSYIVRLSQWGIGGGDFPVKITLLK
jgi:hypothetical protein